ncbi:hypothetical protein ABZV65_08720 [Streptomyces bauhiniae]|uniref:hypothetical protein n=1 Tax=Streptomyces bauhiniae TaxID=2340725 RepID=UPI0033B21799
MRNRTIVPAATASLLLTLVTACSGPGPTHGSRTEQKPAAATSGPKVKPSIDCSDQSLDQATWVANCSDKARTDGSGTGGDGTAGTQTLPWGKAAKTVGAQSPANGGPGGGDLEVTPATVLYTKATMGYTSTNGTFVVITVKDRASGSTGAAESAPIEGGGWQWIASDGQALDEGENDASSITPHGFTGGGMIKVGTWEWDTVAFDLSTAQAKGGTLAYTDGSGTVFKWNAPARDTGPEQAAVRKGMAGSY